MQPPCRPAAAAPRSSPQPLCSPTHPPTHPQDDTTGFAQLTVRVPSQQRFAAYDKAGRLVAGDPEKVRIARLLSVACWSVWHRRDEAAHRMPTCGEGVLLAQLHVHAAPLVPAPTPPHHHTPPAYSAGPRRGGLLGV